MQRIKKSVSFVMIFLMITSCVTTSIPLKKDNLEYHKPGNKITITTHEGEVYNMYFGKVSADTLYGRDQINISKPVLIPVNIAPD